MDLTLSSKRKREGERGKEGREEGKKERKKGIMKYSRNSAPVFCPWIQAVEQGKLDMGATTTLQNEPQATYSSTKMSF